MKSHLLALDDAFLDCLNMTRSNKVDDGITIGEGTKIRVGLILTILGLLAGIFGGGIWWAASMSASMSTLVSNSQTLQSEMSKVGAVSMANTHRIDLMDKSGSEALNALKLEVKNLEKEMIQLREQLRLYHPKP